ncbi:MAG TPA: RES family NAD+ phosphorylase [Candidatus Polarisedimenticolaceae bacterium]|nr:RES family NAD+ phosphorylase [Candidatus Polarisedimenticolaceae bacterium]
MSSAIWTRCAGSSRLGALAARPFRVVEAQHLVATRRLVDSAAEHAVLETLLEQGKPPLPADPEFAGLHFLLTTSFRYPPLPHGSRFATRWERSLWYGARELRTAFAEAAYYRLVFLEGTRVDLGTLDVELSAFRVAVRSSRGVDLTQPPFAEHAASLASPTRYGHSQALGAAMREAGVEAFRYRSARDPDAGAGIGLFTPRAFAAKRPETPETWMCSATKERVEFQRKDFFDRRTLDFPRQTFLVDGRLPAPAL